ncbi:hypothetical protein KP509_19G037700 [Ceratopteris richardii]|uniref:Uncharacterized protein n=1 Tax=Ceratopteris richardii TaxID=49495 RepID=A0A8T2SN44_CERRI|nr:hypothetical protein KP509_19G037700 [Ceratopteris richardii]KAH7352273.1 hypothetical protein KP509_19G037700 [Ceratopteris richardii]
MATFQPVRMMGSGPITHPGGVPDKIWKKMQRKQLRAIQRKMQFQREQEMKHRQIQLWALTERLMRDVWTPPEQNNVQRFLTPDGTPSQRFFPSHVVYSTRIYKKIDTFTQDEPAAEL